MDTVLAHGNKILPAAVHAWTLERNTRLESLISVSFSFSLADVTACGLPV